MQPTYISLSAYTYDLPEEQIARYPLKQRDQSRLLVYRNGEIRHRHFFELPEEIPAGHALVFNHTRVIEARLFFTKPTGTQIQVLTLRPADENPAETALSATGSCTWNCIIGNKKKWKENEVLSQNIPGGMFYAEWVNREQDIIRFHWNPEHLTFSQLLEKIGQLPIPPYLNRDTELSDTVQYQTVYAKEKGSVAAPTAGLHFTETVLQKLEQKSIALQSLTLHVGAGTFKPIKSDNVLAHEMHAEELVFTRENIAFLLKHSEHLIAVGTTSLRSLESLYWFGVKLLQGNSLFFIQSNDPWQLPVTYSVYEAWDAVATFMDKNQLSSLHGHTAIYIYPGYTIRTIQGIVTNFHQPNSTLLLLIATLIGTDWKTVYHEALSNNYRFLSYGDSSLLWKKENS